MKRLLIITLSLAISKGCCAIAGMGENSWNDDRGPWDHGSSFGIEGFFILVWLAISFAIVLVIYVFTYELFGFSRKIQTRIIIIAPCILIYTATCFHNGIFTLFAFSSVISSIVYFSAYLDR